MKLHTNKQEQYFNEVIRLFYSEGLTKSEIATRLPIDRKTILRWILMYEKDPSQFPAPWKSEPIDEASLPQEPKMPQLAQEQGESYVKDLELKIQILESKLKEVESQLNYERLRVEYYNMMIDLTESKYKIQIRPASAAL
jgi:transposase